MTSFHTITLVNIIGQFLIVSQTIKDLTAFPTSLNQTQEIEQLYGANQRRLSRKKRSGLTACTATCPDQSLGSTAIPGSTASGYNIVRKEMTWKEAHDYCEVNFGHLASFENEVDAKKVVDAIFLMSKFDEDYDWGRKQEEFGLDRRYWIGLTDIMEEGKWAWVGKGKFLTYQSMWYPSQPDHVNPDGTIKSGRRQHCVSLWNPAYWKVDANKKPTEKHTFDDVECDLNIYFICEDNQALIDKRKTAINSPSSGGGGGASNTPKPTTADTATPKPSDPQTKPAETPKPEKKPAAR